MSTWYWVWSTSKLHTRDKCMSTLKALVADDEAMEAWGTKSEGEGFWCHQCMPCERGDSLVMFSMWEAKEGKTGAEFDAFLMEHGCFDSPKLFNHSIMRLMTEALKGSLVPSKFDTTQALSEWHEASIGKSTIEKTGRKTFMANTEEGGGIKVDGKSRWFIIWHSLRPGQTGNFYTTAGAMMEDVKEAGGGWAASVLNAGGINGMAPHQFIPIDPADGGCMFFCCVEFRPEMSDEQIDTMYTEKVMGDMLNNNFFEVNTDLIGGVPVPRIFIDKNLSPMQASTEKVMEVMI